MDPITAVGFASSILTFVDFGYQIVTGTLEIAKSGSTSDNIHTSTVIEDFQKIVKKLSPDPLAKSSYEVTLKEVGPSDESEHELALKELAKKCQSISKDLLDILKALATAPGSSTWASARIALRAMRRKDKIESLQKLLNQYRSEIIMRMVFLLNQRELSVQVQLNDFLAQVKSSDQQSEDATDKLNDLRDELLETVKQTLIEELRTAPPVAPNDKIKQDLGEQLRQVKALQETLDATIQTIEQPSPEMRILKRIHFEAIYRREDILESFPADADTFEWILEETPKNEPEITKEDIQMDKETKAARSLAQYTLQSWLRDGNGIFHISGKAGSGKSTLMKLLVDHKKTQEMLKDWAGDSQLIFAHFFFWKAGEDIQHTLDGFYRSILFEILIQFPELIPQVFQRAYKALSKNKPQESIDELFFRRRDFEKAFKDLMSTSPRRGYRICLFIDGLDEYGGDDIELLSTQHQDLADALRKWASHHDIKILASSRPHREFEDTFPDLRIRLHTLTSHDITLFCCNMFKKHQSFLREEVQKHYKRLVETVVSSSDGVFLWARFAMCILLNWIRRYEPIDSLEEQIRKLPIPDNINKLYEKMFDSISSVDRYKAFKMLLFVSQNKYRGLNALKISWLSELEKDSEFPLNCEMKPYTDEEISRRHHEVEILLDSVTKGLLEVVHSTVDDPYLAKQVTFFHRTVHDFVRESKIIQDFSIQLPGFTSENTYGRLSLAELWFSQTQSVKSHLPKRLSFEGKFDSRYKLLDAFGRVIDYHNKCHFKTSQSFLYPGTVTGPGEIRSVQYTAIPLSLIHELAYNGEMDDVGYFKSKLSTNPELINAQGELSLLLVAAISRGQRTTVKTLLDAGSSPHDQVKLRSNSLGYTVWQLFCAFFAVRFINSPWRFRERQRFSELERQRHSEFETLEYFLKAGVDPNCFIVLTRTFGSNSYYTYSEGRHSRLKGPGSHVISLRDLVQQLNPPNCEIINELMDKYGMDDSKRPEYVWKSDEVDATTFLLEDYSSFSIDMQVKEHERDTNPQKLKGETPTEKSPNEGKRWFFVQSIVWKQVKVPVVGLQIRRT